MEYGTFLHWIRESFTPEQLKMKQIAVLIDDIVMETGRYTEVVPQKIYQKIS